MNSKNMHGEKTKIKEICLYRFFLSSPYWGWQLHCTESLYPLDTCGAQTHCTNVRSNNSSAISLEI